MDDETTRHELSAGVAFQATDQEGGIVGLAFAPLGSVVKPEMYEPLVAMGADMLHDVAVHMTQRTGGMFGLDQDDQVRVVSMFAAMLDDEHLTELQSIVELTIAMRTGTPS